MRGCGGWGGLCWVGGVGGGCLGRGGGCPATETVASNNPSIETSQKPENLTA